MRIVLSGVRNSWEARVTKRDRSILNSFSFCCARFRLLASRIVSVMLRTMTRSSSGSRRDVATGVAETRYDWLADTTSYSVGSPSNAFLS